MRRSVAQSIKSIGQSLKNISPERGKEIEEEMKEQGIKLPGEVNRSNKKVDVKIERKPDKQKIAGYNANKYHIYADGVLYQEIWFSEDLDVYKEIDMKKMKDFQSRVTETLSYLYSGEDASVESNLEYQKAFERGYPLKTVQFLGYNKAIIEVTGAKETEIVENEYEIMNGFSRKTLDEVMKMNVVIKYNYNIVLS